MTDEKVQAYATLRHVLVSVCQLLAPATPFLTEHVYGNLVARRSPGAPLSIHLTPFPAPDPALEDPALEAAVSALRQALSVGLAARSAAGLKVRQPLARAVIAAPPDAAAAIMKLAADLCEELNVERVETVPALDATPRAGVAVAAEGGVTVVLDTEITPALRRKGTARAFVHQVQV